MTYSETLHYIHSLERFGIQPGLTRIEALLHALGDPQDALSCVHVAGTNGKGSTCTMLAGGLSKAGYTVGLYTSPYVLDFRERIQLLPAQKNAEMIAEDDLARIASIVRPLADEIGVTEFEFITACAFFFFAEQQVDVAVIEVGLGGRFDATNVIKKPLCSVLATIGLDHTAILGDTLSAIAQEKAGIIKEGCPVVSTYLQPTDALDVFSSVCDERNAPFTMPDERHLTILGRTLKGTQVDYFGKRFTVPFPGDHMVANALTALHAAFVLRDVHGFSLHNDSFLEGLEAAAIPARQELLRESPPLLLDGSHNPDGLWQLSETVRRFLPKENSLLVLGMLKDKDVASSVRLIAPLFARVVTVTPDNPRAMDAKTLASLIREQFPDLPVTPRSVPDAAKEAVNHNGACVVAGSLYLAAQIRPMLNAQCSMLNDIRR